MTGRTSQLNALTGLRGIAAWLVVIYHVRQSLSALVPDVITPLLAKGYLAVDLFFLLSGFVIWYNYAERLNRGGAAEARIFLWRRFARIWPLHAVVLSAYVAFALVLLLTGRDTANYPFAELPLHLMLIQNWGFTGLLTWNHPAWSISTEFAAYLLFPLVVVAMPLHRWRSAWLFGLAAGLVAALCLKFSAAGFHALGDDIPRMGLWRCLTGFTLGNVLAVLWLRWRGEQLTVPAATLASLMAAIAGAGFGLPEAVAAPVAFFSGLLALASARGWVVRLLSCRPLRYLGEISYSTYLAHFLLWALWKIAFVDASLQLGWASLGGFLALVLTVSIVSYHGIERPAQRWLNAHAPRWIARPTAVAAE